MESSIEFYNEQKNISTNMGQKQLLEYFVEYIKKTDKGNDNDFSALVTDLIARAEDKYKNHRTNLNNYNNSINKCCNDASLPSSSLITNPLQDNLVKKQDNVNKK
jgi:hypothetical protein